MTTPQYKPTTKHLDLESFKQTHQIETSLAFNWKATHKPSGTTAHGITERLAVFRLCMDMGMVEFPR